VEVDKKTCKLQIWDTAGQERYRTITSAYYRGADAIVMVYDVSNRDSFRHVNDWLIEVNRYSAEDCCKLLIGNKCDLQHNRTISKEEGEDFANELNVEFVETSAMSGDGVEKAFMNLTHSLIQRGLNRESMAVPGSGSGAVPLKSRSAKNPGNCC
jgi:Ras-related protein Rab-1A